MCDDLLPAGFEIDHTKPLHLGGEDCLETNAQALCLRCHSTKSMKENICRLRANKRKRVESVAEAAEKNLLCNNPFLSFAHT